MDPVNYTEVEALSGLLLLGCVLAAVFVGAIYATITFVGDWIEARWSTEARYRFTAGLIAFVLFILIGVAVLKS